MIDPDKAFVRVDVHLADGVDEDAIDRVDVYPGIVDDNAEKTLPVLRVFNVQDKHDLIGVKVHIHTSTSR